MKDRIKGLIIGLILGATITTSGVFATNGSVLKELFYKNIKITLDNKEITPTDANGNYAEPFIIDGTTYLPVRGISSALGLGVDWDGNTNTVKLFSDKNQQATSTPSNEKVIYNKNGIKITYLNYEYDYERDYYYFKANLLIENNSPKDISLYSDDKFISINGYMVDGTMVTNVGAGKKAKDFIYIPKEEFTKNGISEIENVEIGFNYWFNNSYEYTGTLTILP